jgi:tricarballylate dehydrogenase
LAEHKLLDPPGGAVSNARLSGGLFLFSHNGTRDVLPLVGLDESSVDVEPYPARDYLASLVAMSDGRADHELSRALVADSLDGMRWLAEIGVRFQLTSAVFGSYRQHERIVVPPGPALESAGAGDGLVNGLAHAVKHRGLSIRYGCPVVDLVVDDEAVVGARLASGEEITRFDSVVLATGGFEASPRMRRRAIQ